MQISKKAFGKDHQGRPVTEYTLTNAAGASVSVTGFRRYDHPYFDAGQKRYVLGDVVLGYDDALSYMQNSGYLGALIGRYGNRIGGASALRWTASTYPLTWPITDPITCTADRMDLTGAFFPPNCHRQRAAAFARQSRRRSGISRVRTERGSRVFPQRR